MMGKTKTMMTKKRIAVLGATGSIGVQTLDVVRETGCAEIVALTAHTNIDVLEKQIHACKPLKAVVTDEAKAAELRARLALTDSQTEVLCGMDGMYEVVSMPGVDCVVNAVVGNIGLQPTMCAIESGKEIALANKETLVTSGEIVMAAAKAKDVPILPIDSEHSAVFQSLQGNGGNPMRTLYLTASGGPFRTFSAEQLERVTAADALKHPNWSMGAKITIDSASMMNKGLEVIEARWLFDVSPSQIEVLVHPQSVIHSMVEYEDGAVMAQLGEPDMRVPIQYALTYPKRAANTFPRLDFLARNNLTFEPPKRELFPCLDMAYDALRIGGLMPTVLNGANEAAVALFLAEKIRFLDIARLIECAMSAYTVSDSGTARETLSIDAVLAVDAWARAFVAGQ